MLKLKTQTRSPIIDCSPCASPFADTYFRPEPLPDRVFRGKFMVLNDKWSMELANQNSLRFQHKARDYRERINLTLRRSDLREAYEGSEILALDG